MDGSCRWAGIAVFAGVALGGCRAAARDEGHDRAGADTTAASTAAACPASADSAALVRVALDTVARHTGYRQRSGEYFRMPYGHAVHTTPEVSNVSDVGGTVRFDCDGRVALVLQDGG